MQKFIDYFIPDNYQGSELNYRKANTLVWTLVVTYVFTINYAFISYIVDFKKGMIAELTGSFVYLAMLFLFRATGNIPVVSNITIFCATVCITICCWYSGGYTSGVLPWLGFPAIVVMMISDEKSGWFWLTINATIISIICILYAQGYVFPKEYNESMKILDSICYIGLVVILFVIALVFEKGKTRALDDLGGQIQKTDNLLLNILPKSIAERLKKGEKPLADYFKEASVVFIDIVNFTEISIKNKPDFLVEMLNDIFTKIDAICARHQLEKIKTIGDCYMAVSGIPVPSEKSTVNAALFAKDVLHDLQSYKNKLGQHIKFRIGIDSGPVVAGVIGDSKFIYDLWGDTVNTASRMESSGIENTIHCTDNFKKSLEKHSVDFEFYNQQDMAIKGKGTMSTWVIKYKINI